MRPPRFDVAAALGWLPLAVALPLYLVGLGWGWGPEALWSWDEPRPAAVLAAPYADAAAWPVRYPLLHRDLLHALYAVVAPCARAAGVTEPAELERTLFLAGRALTVLLALVTLWLAFSTAAALGSRRAGLVAAGVWLATLPQTFYAKTTNLDAPYLFWSALAIWGYVRLRHAGELRAAPLFVLGAGAAVLTKDQSYGLFVLPALALAAGLLRRQPSAREARRAAIRLALSLAAALLLAVASYRLLAGPELLIRHLRSVLAHPATYGSTAPDLDSPWELTRLALRHLGWCFGPPLAPLVAAGLGYLLFVARRRGDPARPAAALLLFPVSYALFSLAPLGYHYDRFFLPVCWVLAVVAGVGCDRALSAATPRLARGLIAAALALAVGWGIARAAALDAALVGDRRLVLERATRGRPRIAVYALEVRPPQGFTRWRVERRAAPALARLAPYQVVAIPAMDMGDLGLSRLANALRRGACGFRATRPELATRSPLQRWVDFRGVLSNLAEIDPPQLVFERDDLASPCPEPLPTPPLPSPAR